MSNVRQAKKIAEHLNEIGCFYTDRPVAYEIVKKFNDDELLKLGRNEHRRWEEEKMEMCWLPGEKFESKLQREQTRIHSLLNTHYDDLCKEEQLKDTEPLNNMVKLLKEYDGLRIFRIPQSTILN
jgi:arginyl-tRNA synthetase